MGRRKAREMAWRAPISIEGSVRGGAVVRVSFSDVDVEDASGGEGRGLMSLASAALVVAVVEELFWLLLLV